MGQSEQNNTCALVCKVIAVVVGIILFFLMNSGLSAFLSLILAVIAGVLLWLLLPKVFCSGSKDFYASSAAPETVEPKAKPTAADATAAPEVEEPEADPAPVVASAPVDAPEVDEPEETTAASEPAPSEDVSSNGDTNGPEVLAGARDGSPDDLKKIKGVGPQLEKTLNELGFFHFDQVAAWTEADVEWVDSRLKFKGRITRDDWIAQAKELAGK